VGKQRHFTKLNFQCCTEPLRRGVERLTVCDAVKCLHVAAATTPHL
jgi:hypothetical protein